MLSMMACNNSTSSNSEKMKIEVSTDTIELVDTIEKQGGVEPKTTVEQSADEQARRAYQRGDDETLVRLAKQGNSAAIDLCESAGINIK